MSKMKDLITDVTFTLVKKFSHQIKGKTEEAFTYECKETGAVVSFCAHPTRAWNWIVLDDTNNIGQVMFSTVVEAFVKAGIERGEKSFDDAIKYLDL